ncbi:hypothetical protein R6Q59_021725 [Mikania micrantha]|uniref:Glycosyltransferase n=1 Tax=Mikania micrantha TaxID=192012 RepID=A0A5N6MXG0_9ASTR|nr:hypothetical protein E3N88_26766 [Mikania micrantha]
MAELIFIPAPGLGHIMPTIEIAKVFVNRDQRLSVTVLVIKPPSSSSGSEVTAHFESLAKTNTINRISFIELPQDEAPPMRDLNSFVTSFNDFIKSHSKYVRNVVTDLKNRTGFGRLVGFVVDMFCTCMIDVANEFNVPTNVFFTSNAAFLGFKMFIQTLSEDMNQDVVALSNSDIVMSVPSFVKPLPTKVFWSILQTREGLEFALSSARKLKKVNAIMVNTFLELETHAIKSLSDDISIPPVYPVGPVINLEGGSRKPYDDDVIKWLDGQPPSSVVVLCFGSMGCFNEAQVKEIAHALEHSGHRFIWSLRRPPDKTTKVPSDHEDFRVVLPDGFLERTDGIGKVIGWAPQVALLAHNAVGGFVSHCGWNSLLESLWFGVPVATWPMYSEQQMNAFEMVVELGLAVEIKWDYAKDLFNPKAKTNVICAKEIENGIRRVMEDTKIRTKVKDMSVKSRATVVEGGSSYVAVGNIINNFMKTIS